MKNNYISKMQYVSKFLFTNFLRQAMPGSVRVHTMLRNTTKTTLFILGIVLLTAVSTQTISAQTIVIGYKSGIKKTNGDNNENHTLNSSMRTATMSKLLNASNFGPSGKSPFTIVFYDFQNTAITEALLNSNNISIFDMGISNDDGGSGTQTLSYTASEIAAVKTWTSSSLSHVVLAYQGYATALGGANYIARDANVGLNNITTLGASILNGPFGDFTPFNQSGSYTGIFSKADVNSCELIIDAPTKSPTGLVNNATGDIYLADVGLLEKDAGLTDGVLISSATDILVANLYHGLAQISQNQPLSACKFFSCTAGINGPKLSATSISIKCPATSTNLNSLVVGALPTGTTLKWFTTSTHTAGTEVTNPASVPAGTYYAFYYGGTDDCYSPYTKVVAESGITISTNTLSDFSYVFGSGPSAMQTLIVSGACLTNDIIITPPTYYEISSDGINWINGTTTPATITLTQTNGTVENTNIYIRLKAGLNVSSYNKTMDITSTNADTKRVTLTGRVVDYCTSTTTNTGSIYISSVTFNGSTNPSSSSSYTDFTSINYAVNKGNSYNLSVNIFADAGYRGYYNGYCKVWIDWNHDGDFNDIGESYDLGQTRGKNTTTTASPYSITVPVGATAGKTRMRVSCSSDANQLDPCATITWGEVEDYSITILKNYWKGTSTSTDWSLGSNWTAGVVPADGDDVEYLNGTAPNTAANDLQLDQNRTIGNLINATTKSLIIPAGKSLKVNSSIQTGGFDDRIVIKTRTAATPTVASGSLIFQNAYKVHATVEMYTKAYQGPVVTLSDGTKYSYNWQFFGIPLTQVVADPTFAGSYVRIYNESQQGARTKWTQLTNSSILYPFKGYEITQKDSTIIYFTGELVNNSTTIQLPYTTDPLVYEQGQHILSNPYTAAIDVRKLIFGNNTENTAYLYNTGSFASWYNNNGGTTYDENPAKLAGQYLAIPQRLAGMDDALTNDIPSMSSFLVKATNSLAGSVTINYGSVIFNNKNPQRVKSSSSVNLSATDLISTKIDLIGQHYADRMWIFTEPSCTKNFDNGWDGRKILGSSLAPQIYAIEPDGNYQVNSVDDMHNTDIAFQPGDEVEYTLKFTNENIKRKYAGVYLVDLVENKTVDVTESGSTYKFATAPASEPSKRFKIITRYYEKDAPDTESTVKIFSARGAVFIQNLSANSGECTLYDILGRAIIKKNYGPNSVTEVGGNLTLGAYITTAITNGEKVSKRIIVQ